MSAISTVAVLTAERLTDVAGAVFVVTAVSANVKSSRFSTIASSLIAIVMVSISPSVPSKDNCPVAPTIEPKSTPRPLAEPSVKA